MTYEDIRNQILSYDAMLAFASSYEAIDSKWFDEIDAFTAQMFFIVEKAKHHGFWHGLRFIGENSNISLLFPKKYRDKFATSRIISAILEISCSCTNWYYLDNKGIPYIFQIPLTEKSCIDKSVSVVYMRFEILSNGCGLMKKYTTLYNPTKKTYSTATHVHEKYMSNLYRCPKTGLSYPPCNTCSTMKVKTKRCGGCVLVSYCSKKCQKKDWKTHKAICKKT